MLNRLYPFPRLWLLVCLFIFDTPNNPKLSAQAPARPDGAQILQSIKKLQVLGSVMYVAAHPDDENQRLISYLANVKHYDVTYLSLTRGDGGQNLIGTELRELLGVLRTQELLMARANDGGKQVFSRANDFGFSKSPEETLQFWERDEVLADVVWQFRLHQPDIVVNRFYHDKKYDTHGHHTASAMLSVEAFKKAARRDVFPEQLQYADTWQPRRIFFNTSWFFYGSREAFDKVDKSNLFSVDVGVYLPLLGKNNNEIASEARSKHRCQGFGGLNLRGESMEYLDFIDGDRPRSNDLFEGINTTWTRVAGGAPIKKLLAKIEKNYRADHPAASVPDLIKAMILMKKLPDGFWKRKKLKEIKEVIRHCAGIYLESTTAEATVTPGEHLSIQLEYLNRAGLEATLVAVQGLPGLFDTLLAQRLGKNQYYLVEKKVRFPENIPFTAPYWLEKKAAPGMYSVENQQLIGLPETPRTARVRWHLTLLGEPFEYETELVFKQGLPERGEIYEPFDVLPPVFVGFAESSYFFPQTQKSVEVQVKSGRDKIRGTLRLQVPAGWKVSAPQTFELQKKGELKTLQFELTAPPTASHGELRAIAEIDGKLFDRSLTEIRYEHIPTQRVLMPATVPVTRLDVQFAVQKIGYIMGAGDDVPAALRQAGLATTLLDDKEIEPENLSRYDAIVVGVRAYNTRASLKYLQKNLQDYVQQGGTLVVQYNTYNGLVVKDLAPYPLKISRIRVTDETAPVRLVLPQHAVLNTPNIITEKDFEGWVQERGLYFPSEWDEAFSAPLSCNDPDETPHAGGLLVAKYGKGHYIYTGLSFFRQLPAGVPGAMRLFANLVSLGK